MTRQRDLMNRIRSVLVRCSWLAAWLLTACLPQGSAAEYPFLPASTPTPTFAPLPVTERPVYSPGELVDYTAQTGDTLSNLAFRFNTTVAAILDENPIIPADATTLPPGLPMTIPIYYEALWGSQFQILPNCAFINGPAQVGFDVAEFVESQPGWLKAFQQFAAEETRSGAGIVSYVAHTFSISPRLLLAILEYQLGALSNPLPPTNLRDGYPLGYEKTGYHGLYIQLVWAANALNQGYYGWLTNHLDTIEFRDQTIEHPDPWQNAGSVGLQYYFSLLESRDEYNRTISPQGFLLTYEMLFGDPWTCESHIPGSLLQPTFRLPFESGKTWAFTGGPHTGWGQGDPLAALDFAPPSAETGCEITSEWAVAVAPGVIAHTGVGRIELDLDGDGDIRTGWVILYLHLGSQYLRTPGTWVEAGDNLGHPSCEGGESTGSHIHIARKYNGEWIPAAGVIPFVMDDWVPHQGPAEYLGTLTRFTETVTASVEAEEKSLINAPTPVP